MRKPQAKKVHLSGEALDAIEAFLDVLERVGAGVPGSGEGGPCVPVREPRKSTTADIVAYATKLATAQLEPGSGFAKRVAGEEAVYRSYFRAMNAVEPLREARDPCRRGPDAGPDGSDQPDPIGGLDLSGIDNSWIE